MQLRLLAISALLVVPALAGLGCVLPSASVDQGGSGGSGNSGGSGGSNPCLDCINGYCTPESNACIANPACQSLVNCLNGCASGDTTCDNACYDSNPEGVNDWNNYLSCAQTYCTSVCT